MSSTSRLIRGACVGAAALGALALAPSASASDTFFLKNESKVATLTGESLWGKGNTMNAGCRSGPFPGPTLTSFTFNPGDQGSITLSQDPFSKCLAGINPLVDNPLTSPFLTNGEWSWIPTDPVIGYATLYCDLSYEYGSQPVEFAVDGLTCTISDAGGQTQGAFTSSGAQVRGGGAVASVHHYPGTQAPGAPVDAANRGRYEFVIKDKKGKVHGRTKATVASGKSRKVRIPVSKELREQIAMKGQVRVKATLKRADGQPGAGDVATLVLGQARTTPKAGSTDSP